MTFLGEKSWKISTVLENFLIFKNHLYKVYKMQHFRKCIYILSIFVCSLSGPGGSPYKRPYDVSCGENRYVTLP